MNLTMNDGDLTVKNIKNGFLSIKHDHNFNLFRSFVDMFEPSNMHLIWSSRVGFVVVVVVVVVM